VSNWRTRAACVGSWDLFADRSLRYEAAHICRHHCDVLTECSDWSTGARLSEVTAGGTFWTSDRKASTQLRDPDGLRLHNQYCRALERARELGEV
jgi:hypothetical protein